MSAYDSLSKVRNTIIKPLRSLGNFIAGRVLSVLSTRRAPSETSAITCPRSRPSWLPLLITMTWLFDALAKLLPYTDTTCPEMAVVGARGT